MGLFQNLLPLPDANIRLNLDDQARVELFARRFDRFRCVIFDEQSMLERNEGIWTEIDGARVTRLGSEGKVVNFNA